MHQFAYAKLIDTSPYQSPDLSVKGPGFDSTSTRFSAIPPTNPPLTYWSPFVRVQGIMTIMVTYSLYTSQLVLVIGSARICVIPVSRVLRGKGCYKLTV